jgi:hypothetical protein
MVQICNAPIIVAYIRMMLDQKFMRVLTLKTLLE